MNSKRNVYAQMAAIMALGAMMSPRGNQGRPFDPEDVPAVKPVIPKGCKEYTFYGITVIASNEKTAIKKCKRKAGIK